jgi:hypothetical protein
MPSKDEIITLVDRSRAGHSPMIDEEVFPAIDMSALEYWTSTPYTRDGLQSWCLSFSIGTLSNCGIQQRKMVYLVRPGR